MTTDPKDTLVDGNWLEDRLNDASIRVFDATWFMPQGKKNAQSEYEKCHIPGAVRFDIDDIAQPGTDLPHMIPDANLFQEKISALGVTNSDTVVVYDANGGASAAARAWWLMRLFGHQDVRFLDGGLPAWLRENRPVQAGIVDVHAKAYAGARLNTALVRSKGDMVAAMKTGGEVIVDARSPGRFNGTEPEPRQGLRGGHIPGSVNLPFGKLLRPDGDCRLKPLEEVREIFNDAQLDIAKPMVMSCGSGVTACIPALALYLLGVQLVPVYDGSWTEWASDDTLPIE